MPECEDEDCGEVASRRIRCFHCGLLVCPWCWHHLHGCMPGHQKADCRDHKRFVQYGREWIRRLRSRITVRQALCVLERSYEVIACAACGPKLYAFKITDLEKGTPEAKVACPTCKLSFKDRYHDFRKREIEAELIKEALPIGEMI